MSKSNLVTDAAAEFKGRATKKQKLQAVLHKYPWVSSAVVLVFAIFIFSFGNENFLTPNNLSLILQQTAVIGAIAAGQTLIILTAGIDLSCGAIAIFASMVMAKTAFVNGWPGWAAFMLGIAVGTGAGAFNGWLITKINLPPFIVTLGTYNVFSALTLFYATGRTIMDKELEPFFLYLGNPIPLGEFRITYGVLLVIVMYLILAFSLRYTGWGRHVYAVGDDIEAARLAGIQVKRVLMSVYVTAGFIFAVTSWVIIGRVAAASPNSGSNLNLDSITAVVIGGTSLFGGRGAIFGSLIGAVIVGVFRNGLTLAGVDLYYQTFAVGVLIITAVSIDQWIRKAGV
ncbi:MAG: ABC transporter permease [Candidatus Nanopelagicaceae bacterium]|nr:ABC transporter permease [Candidatus Nanopelagicaceae bacterium]